MAGYRFGASLEPTRPDTPPSTNEDCGPYNSSKHERRLSAEPDNGHRHAYAALMVFGGRAERMAAQHIIATEQRTPRRVLAAPVLANSFRRELVLDFGESYRFGRMDWFPLPRITLDARDVPTNLRDPAVEAVRGRLYAFLYWSRYAFFRIDDQEQPPVVIVGDAGRFGRSEVLRVPYAPVK